MRAPVLAATVAAVALGQGAVSGPAHAASLVIGGLAGACYQDAKAGRFDQDALDTCSRALAGDPLDRHDLAGTYVNRGAMELRSKDLEAARADFLAAMAALPTLGEAYVGEGAYYVSLQRYAQAEPLLSRGIALGVEQPERAYSFRGVARWGEEDFKGAYLDFKKASELKPDWSLPKEQLANFHVQRAP